VVLILRQQRLYSRVSNIWSIATQQVNTDVHNGIPTATMVLPLRTKTLHKSPKFEFVIVTSALNWTTSSEEQIFEPRKQKNSLENKAKAQSRIIRNRKPNTPKRKDD